MKRDRYLHLASNTKKHSMTHSVQVYRTFNSLHILLFGLLLFFFFIYLMCWNKLILRPEWSKNLWFQHSYWTTMFSDKQFAFWMVQCGAGSWTWWSLRVPSKSGYPSILWLSSFNQNSALRKLLLIQNYFKIQNFTFFLFS